MKAFEMDIDKDYEECLVLEVWSGRKWYSTMRIEGQRALCVMWEDRSITVEPICNLIDSSEQAVNEKLVPVMYNWIHYNKKMKCPSKCLFCNDLAKTSILTCEDCYTDMYWLEEFMNTEKINRTITQMDTTTINILPQKRQQEQSGPPKLKRQNNIMGYKDTLY